MRTLPTLAFLLLSAIGIAQPTLNFTPLSLSGPALVQPLFMSGCGDGSGRLFVVEKRGTIRIIQNNVVSTDFFLDIQDLVMNSGERGLLGLAFHPQYPTTPYIYVNYVIDGTITNRISRFTLNPNNSNDIQENTEFILLEQAGVQTNHKAGGIAFGPDGYLYIGMGDGGGGGDPSNSGQNLETLLAKMLRIDVNAPQGSLNYTIPPDNPFVGEPGRDEIWAYGLRNPWRISFDRETGDFWIADVGQNLWEEVDMVLAGTPGGMNFGWDCREGNHDYEPGNCGSGTEFTWPIFEYPHSCNPCPNGYGASISGGYVYRGSEHPVLEGFYVCADYVSNYLWMIKVTSFDPLELDVYVQDGNGLAYGLVTFGEDDDGELYASNLDGVIYSVSASGFLPVQWGSADAHIIQGGNQIDWTIHQTLGIEYFEVQRSLYSGFDNFTVVTQVEPVEDQISYKYIDPFIHTRTVYYRIAAHMSDGSIEYSPFMRILPDTGSKPSLVFDQNHNLWRINIPNEWQNGEVILYDLQGKEVYTRKIGSQDQLELTPPITPGSYFVKVSGEMGTWSERLVW
ncbi:MAG: PQQ-dependent sugar dehydrogenase [Saprospiraceae bacterium]|nr:PQQ-dependent sugar dehydrogenase [Candidatus Opimibacter skivensis]